MVSTDPGVALGLAARINKVSVADLQAAARQFLKPDQYVQAVLYPAAMQPPASGEARVVRCAHGAGTPGATGVATM